MTRSSGFARISLTSAGWILPWVAVLFVSVTLAYALTSAVSGGASASEWEVRATPLTGEAAQAADLEQSTTSLSDTAMERPAGTFGGMSVTSPASTGHASPSGCCTWD